MSKVIPPNKSIFFYDGDCGFCRKLSVVLKKLNKSPDIVFLSFRKYNGDELLKLHPNLVEEVLEGEVQFIHKNTRYPGFFAVRKLLPNLRYFWILTPFLYLPLIPFLGMLAMVVLKKIKN